MNLKFEKVDEFSSGNAKGRNILTLIIAHENIRILKYLLTKLEPESLEKKDGTEMKPLGLAAYLGKEDMVKFFPWDGSRPEIGWHSFSVEDFSDAYKQPLSVLNFHRSVPRQNLR